MPPKTKAKADKNDLPAHLADQYAKFRLPNGDRYSGEFQANAKTKTFYRHGLGTYTTWDGHRYTATWENDQIAKGTEVRIEFASTGNVFTGLVSPAMDYLSGTYRFHDGSTLRVLKFAKSSVPVAEECRFLDAHGKRWDHWMEKQFLLVRQPQRFAVDGDKPPPAADEDEAAAAVVAPVAVK